MRLNSVVNVDKLSITAKNVSLFVGVSAPYFSRNYKSYIIQYCHRFLDDYTTCDDYPNAILTLSSFVNSVPISKLFLPFANVQ